MCFERVDVSKEVWSHIWVKQQTSVYWIINSSPNLAKVTGTRGHGSSHFKGYVLL